MRLKTITKRAVAGIVSALALIGMSAAPALAASSFSDNVWSFASGQAATIVNFNRGSSQIYDNGNLVVTTDDFLYLNGGSATFVQKVLSVGDDLNINNKVAGTYTGSRIYDNGNLHIATDDQLFVDATSVVFSSGATFTNLPASAGSVSLSPATAQTVLATANVVPLTVQLVSGGNTNILNLNSAAGTTVFSVGATGNTAVSGT